MSLFIYFSVYYINIDGSLTAEVKASKEHAGATLEIPSEELLRTTQGRKSWSIILKYYSVHGNFSSGVHVLSYLNFSPLI